MQPVGPTAVLLPSSGCRDGAGRGAAGDDVKEKTGDIYLTNEKGRCVAYWRPVDGTPDVFLCAAEARTCGDHPHVLQMLTDLACELALNYGRAVDDGVTFRVHAPAPDSKTQWPAFDALRATLRNCPKAVAGKV